MIMPSINNLTVERDALATRVNEIINEVQEALCHPVGDDSLVKSEPALSVLAYVKNVVDNDLKSIAERDALKARVAELERHLANANRGAQINIEVAKLATADKAKLRAQLAEARAALTRIAHYSDDSNWENMRAHEALAKLDAEGGR